MPIRYLMLSLLIATPLSVLADSFLSPFINAPKYSWAAGGYSQDVKERDHRGGIISGGLSLEKPALDSKPIWRAPS